MNFRQTERAAPAYLPDGRGTARQAEIMLLVVAVGLILLACWQAAVATQPREGFPDT